MILFLVNGKCSLQFIATVIILCKVLLTMQESYDGSAILPFVIIIFSSTYMKSVSGELLQVSKRLHIKHSTVTRRGKWQQNLYCNLASMYTIPFTVHTTNLISFLNQEGKYLYICYIYQHKGKVKCPLLKEYCTERDSPCNLQNR